MKTLVKIIFMSLMTVFMLGFINNDIEPKGWGKYGTNVASYQIGVDNQISQHGQKSAFIESIAGIHFGFCTLSQICSGKDFKGKRVKMTSYLKSQGRMDTVQMWLRVDNLNNERIADFDNMQNRRIIGTKDWRKCEIVFDVPDAKCVINYGFLFSGVGKAWFDNISFEIVDKSDKSNRRTANNLYARNPNPVPQMIPEKPVNIDFEE
jgi:hypothetical protein